MPQGWQWSLSSANRHELASYVTCRTPKPTFDVIAERWFGTKVERTAAFDGHVRRTGSDADR
jgi:hypothetical protein